MTNRDDSMEMRTSEQERQWVGAVGGPDDRRHDHDAVGEPQGPRAPDAASVVGRTRTPAGRRTRVVEVGGPLRGEISIYDYTRFPAESNFSSAVIRLGTK